jgi:large subunit ribosomal protein L10
MKAVVKKQATVEALAGEFQEAMAVYLLNYQGLTVEKDNALRKAMRAKGVKYRAVKNTLLKRVLEKMGVTGMDEYLIGATSVMIGTAEDPMQPAREIVDFHKANPGFLSVKGISLDGSAMAGSEVENLSKMPGKKELLGQIVSIVLGPGANLVALFKGPGSTIAGQVKALEEKLEKAE